MAIAAAFLCLLLQPQKVDKPSLELYQRNWVIRRHDSVEHLQLSVTPPSPRLSVLYRRGDSYACWDERGLTVRTGKRAHSTKLPEIAVSPKVQTKELILRTVEFVREKKRRKTASALSGSMRIRNEAFFLVRWDDSAGKPWLESLVSVDLHIKGAKPKLLGRFDGLSTAAKPIDDKLFILDGRLAAIVQGEHSWGIGTYDASTHAFDFVPMGDTLVDYLPQGETKGLFVEKTSYGTTVAGRADLANGKRKTLAEGPSRMKFVDEAEPPLAIIVGPHGHVVRNLSTGAEMPISTGTAIRRGKLGVVIWSPAKSPTAASLMDPKKWSLVAAWAPGMEPNLDQPEDKPEPAKRIERHVRPKRAVRSKAP